MTKLEEAEKTIRDCASKNLHNASISPGACRAIADELDRLRDALKSCERNHEAEQERWRPIGEELARHIPELGDTGDPERVLYAARCVVDDREGARCRAVTTELARMEWEKRAISAEAELAALKGEAERTRWGVADSAKELLDDPATCKTEEEARKMADALGGNVYAVRMSARKVAP